MRVMRDRMTDGDLSLRHGSHIPNSSPRSIRRSHANVNAPWWLFVGPLAKNQRASTVERSGATLSLTLEGLGLRKATRSGPGH